MAPFCSCHASLVSRKFFAVGPGCAKCFFLLRSVGRRDLSAGPEQKKKHHPGCFFFLLRPRGKAREGEAPLGAVFFFCSGPVPAPNEASPSPAFPRGRSKKKKKHPGWCFFFALAPCRRPTGLLLPWLFAFPCLSPGPQQKKNTLGGVFFLLRPRADAHSLTAGLGGDASPSPGWCFCFLLRPRPDRGGVFFFAVAPPGRSLTHGGLRRFRQGPGGVFFFLLRPRRVFLDNNKKCLGYYIGSKKTRRGHSKKKHHFLSGMQGLCNLGGALIILEH